MREEEEEEPVEDKEGESSWGGSCAMPRGELKAIMSEADIVGDDVEEDNCGDSETAGEATATAATAATAAAAAAAAAALEADLLSIEDGGRRRATAEPLGDGLGVLPAEAAEAEPPVLLLQSLAPCEEAEGTEEEEEGEEDEAMGYDSPVR